MGHIEGVEIKPPVTYTTALLENTSATEFATQLEADLATGVRGGNKFRLIARCWVAANGATGVATYEAFRAEWQDHTFAFIHVTFDHVLPAKYRAGKTAAPAADAKELTKKAQKLARTFEHTTELTAEQRQWVRDQGGVEALDARRVALPNGRTFPFLDNSWYGTAQTIQGVIDGRKTLI
ncbi:MAG: hypothetical protein ACO3RL_12370 [Vulcanococcus sp.]